MPFWGAASDYYFRTEIEGWERLPDEPSLLVSVHAGAALTIDAWIFVYEWYRRYGEDRVLHGTAHDVLMTVPVSVAVRTAAIAASVPRTARRVTPTRRRPA